MNNKIKNYYNQLASTYDKNRFANTYGQFIDSQERQILKRVIEHSSQTKTLDMACGTGRFLDFANYGIDLSTEMIKVAKNKYPNRKLFIENAEKTHFEDDFFDQIFSFHLFMHLDKDTTKNILNEAHRILKKGGRLIFDIPSAKRRRMINYKAENWHGANEFSVKEILNLRGDKWKLVSYYGILFLPIHRFPTKFRKGIIALDSLLCRSFLKEYSSYLVFIIEKR